MSDPKILKTEIIIVGLGTAGCVLFSRLSKKYDVIGIEAGENLDDSIPIKNSQFAGIEFGLEENFNPAYLYQQTPLNNGTLENPLGIPVRCNIIAVDGMNGFTASPAETVGIFVTGKCTGGGSSING